MHAATACSFNLTGRDSSIGSRISSELDNFIKFVNLTLSERYANLISEGDSFEARTHCVDERNFKFRGD